MKNTKQPNTRRLGGLFRGALSSGLICLFCPAVAQADYIPSAADGAWEIGATWSGGAVPGAADYANVNNHNVTLGSAVNVTKLATDNAGVLTVNSGGSLTVNTTSEFVGGSVAINSGATLTTGNYIHIGSAGKNANVTVNGTSNVANSTYLGHFTHGNTTSSLTIGNGGVYNGGSLFSFSGGDSSDLSVTVEAGGYFEAGYLQFGQVSTATNRSASFNVAGGDVVITNSNIFATVLNQDGDFVYTGFDPGTIPDWAGIVYDGGSLTFTGVTTSSDVGTIGAFTTVISGWVDNGFLTSNLYTDAELKAGFSVTDGGGVLTIPEPATAGVMLGLISVLAVITRRRR